MDFKEALQKSLKADKSTHSDPFLFHSRVRDLVGDDYEAKKAAEEFYRLDAMHHISSAILSAAPASRQKKKRYACKQKPIPPPPERAFVYFAPEENVLHLSKECSRIRSPALFQACYKHVPDWFGNAPRRICRRCGDFCPTFPTTVIDQLRFFLYNEWQIGSPVKVIASPTLLEEE